MGLWLTGGLTLALASCSRTPAQDTVLEAARMNHAIEALRKAPNPAKQERLEALRKLSCQAAPVCRLKQVCLEAYAAHVAALARVAEVRRAQDRGSTSMLSKRLDRARRALIAAERQTQECVSVQTAFQRRYSLDH